MAISLVNRRFNQHNNIRGNWCRFSGIPASETYTDPHCPHGCKASGIEEEERSAEDLANELVERVRNWDLDAFEIDTDMFEVEL